LNGLCEEVTNLVVGRRIAYYMGLVAHEVQRDTTNLEFLYHAS
jgi:hypothetical protein